MIDLTVKGPGWPLKIIVLRCLWHVVEPLVRFLPKQFSGLRIMALRSFGATIGRRCLIMPGVKVLMPWNLKLGSFVAIGRSVELYNFGVISIGNMTVVSQYSYLCTGTHDYRNPSMPLEWYPITIGSESWLAARVFVAPGVEIGDGAVVGACSVVTRNVPSWSVSAGNPCRVVKPRIMKLKEG